MTMLDMERVKTDLVELAQGKSVARVLPALIRDLGFNHGPYYCNVAMRYVMPWEDTPGPGEHCQDPYCPHNWPRAEKPL